MNITRHKEIDAAVAIVVSPSGARAEAAGGDSGFVGHVLEFAVAEIVVERVAAESRDVNILQAIVVVVGDRNPHAPSPCA